MTFKEFSISEFCDAVAKDAAIPAGGCVCALSAALGASLLEMSASLTLRKAANYGIPADAEIADGCKMAAKAKLRLQELIDEDAAAFDAVMFAFTLPKDTDKQKKTRMDAAQSAYKCATSTLTEIARTASDLTQYAVAVITRGDPAVKSDAIVALRMLHSGILGAVSGIRSNLCFIKDANEAVQLARSADKTETEIETLLKEIML